MQITRRKLNECRFFVYKVQPLKPVKIGKTYSRAMSTLEKKIFCSHNFFPEGFQNGSKENLFFIDCRYIIVVFHSYFSYFLLHRRTYSRFLLLYCKASMSKVEGNKKTQAEFRLGTSQDFQACQYKYRLFEAYFHFLQSVRMQLETNFSVQSGLFYGP